jgi:hypothetical protein
VVAEPGVVRVVASDGLTPVVAAASKGRVRGSCCLGRGRRGNSGYRSFRGRYLTGEEGFTCPPLMHDGLRVRGVLL